MAGATLNSAYSIGKEGEVGSLEVGKAGDVVVLREDNWEHLIYQIGSEQDVIKNVVIGGDVCKWIFKDRLLIT